MKPRALSHSLAVLAVAALLMGCGHEKESKSIALATDLAHRFILIDGHIDVPYRLTGQRKLEGKMDDVSVATPTGDFDYPRAMAGGLDAFFQSIYTPSEYEGKGAKAFADGLIDLVEGIVKSHPDRFVMVRTAAEVRALRSPSDGKRIGFLMGMENGAPLEGDLANLDHFAQRGVRYITLCHAKDNHICDSSYDDRHTHHGLTEFGRQVIARMNELGVLVDVSHVSDDSFYQAVALSKAPVIASHSSVRRYVPRFERNMDDDMLHQLKANGGVIMINFGSTFVDEEINAKGVARKAAFAAELKQRGIEENSPQADELEKQYEKEHPVPYATVSKVADHIEHVVKEIGVDHVGFGSDFDGVGDSLPTGLKDVSQYPNLIAELLNRGFTEPDIEKICGGNVLRILEKAEQVAASLAKH